MRRIADTLPPKVPEAEVTAQKLFPSFVGKDDVVVEVGADIGGGTLVLSRLSKQVYAFEPNPYAFSKLQHATRRKRNVQILNLGAGATEETIRLKLPQLANMPRGSRTAPVRLVKLDDMKFGLAPSCLVIDCGGSELDVLKGAEGYFKSQAIWTVLVKTYQFGETDTMSKSTMWLLDHGLKTHTRGAADGSIWIVARASKRIVRRENSSAEAVHVPP